MLTSIPLTGLAANDPVPGNYIEVNFAQGAASLGATEYSVLLLGNFTSSGSASAAVLYGPDTVQPMNNESDAIALFGAGSELHRGVRAFLQSNNVSKLYCMGITQSGGADGYLAMPVSTTATASGNLRIWVGEEFVDTAIVSGDTTAVIAQAAVDNINSKSHWAVTAARVGGTITFTAKQHGPRGNEIRVKALVSGAGVGTTVSPTASTALSGGATADDNTAALAAILSRRFYYIVSAASDATQVGALLSQVNSQALPITGIRQRVFAGSVSSLATATTFATGLNGARAEVCWLAESDRTCFELACSQAAIASLEEAPAAFRCNFDNYGNDEKSKTNWKVKAPLSGAAPTRAQIKSALNNGLSPIGVNLNGSTYLVSRITTKSQTSSLPDYRIRDAHKVTVCDRYADDLQLQFSAKFSGKQVGDDPIGNAPGPGPIVVTPRVLKAEIDAMTDLYNGRDQLQNAAQIKAGTVVIRESSPTTRLSAAIPLQTCDVLHQIATSLNQVA